MGEVALKYRLMPESPDSDTNAIVNSISGVLPEDASLGAHEVEDALNSLSGVQTVILEEQSLV